MEARWVDRSAVAAGSSLLRALLGALIGVGLDLAVEDAGTSRAVAAPGHGAALAASRPGGQPPASPTTGSGSRAAGNDASGSQQVESADQPDKAHGQARKDGEDRPDKLGNDKPSKDKPSKDKPSKGEPGKDK